MPLAPDTPESQYFVEQGSDLSGGAVDNIENHLIPPNAAEYLLNAELSTGGRRQKIRGVLARGTPGSNIENPNGLGVFAVPNESIHRVVAQMDNRLFRNVGTNVFTQFASSTSLHDTVHMFVQGRGATFTPTLFAASCVPYSANTSLPFGALTAVNKDFSTATLVVDVRPRAIAWHQNRLWAFNSASTLHGADVLTWSAILDGRNFSANNNIRIESDDGDQGVAIIPLRGERPQLLLAKERSIHQLDIYWQTDGFFPATANVLDFTTSRLRTVVFGTGCVATRGLVWVPGLQGADLLFLSREGIRSLSRSITDAQGGAGLPLSHDIDTTIQRINWARADQAVAAFWDNQVYFAVPVDGSETNNFIIRRDLFNNAWSFLDWEAGGFVEAKIDPARKFFFLSSNRGTDGASGVTYGHHLFEIDTGNRAPFRQPMIFEERTRAYTFPSDPNAQSEGFLFQKDWRWANLKVQTGSTAATLTISYKIDDQSVWRTLGHLYLDPEDAYPSLPVQLPFVFDAGKLVEQAFSLHKVPPGFKLQLRVLDEGSFARFKITELTLYATRNAIKFRH